MSSVWLRDHRRVVTSQFGEDGILEAIFDRIGTANKWFCEFGAWDGEYLSNTFPLLRDHDWSGVMIEGDAARAAALAQKTTRFPKLVALHGFVQASGPSSLDNLLARTPIPRDFDLLSIDIDNDDYFVWQALTTYRPRVVVLEVNTQFGPTIVRLPRPGYRGFTERSGCSFAAAVSLAKEKGYELAIHTANCIFVAREYAHVLDIDPVAPPAELFDPSAMRGGDAVHRLRTALGDIAHGRVKLFGSR